MDKILQSIAAAAHRMLNGTGFAFSFIAWEEGKSIRPDRLAINAHPDTDPQQMAEALRKAADLIEKRVN